MSKIASHWCMANAHIITPFEDLGMGWISVGDGKIQAVGKGDLPAGVRNGDHCPVVDVGGACVIPGLIDTHICGMLGSDFRQGEKAFRTIAGGLVRHGVTAFLPTVYLTATEAALGLLSEALTVSRDDVVCSQILGVHLEGPYLGRKYRGLALEELLGSPSIDRDRVLYERHPGFVKLVTLAPELPGCIEYIRFLKGQGVTVSIGHSETDTKAQLDRAIEAGVSHVTHIFNAMAVRHLKEPGVDTPGLADLSLVDDRLTVSVIVDGVHVSPELVELLVRAKPLDSIVLVTDSFLGTAMPPGSYVYPDGVRVVVDDTCHRTAEDRLLAGSILTLERAVKNLLSFTHVSVPQAVQMASYNPAKLIGVESVKGRLAEGYDADMVVVDRDWSVVMTVIQGSIAYRRRPGCAPTCRPTK